MINIKDYAKTAPIDLERFQELTIELRETEGKERLAIASELISLLKKECWRITGNLITDHFCQETEYKPKVN